MRAVDRIGSLIRVALGVMICLAVIISPLRPHAARQGPPNFLRRNFALMPRHVECVPAPDPAGIGVAAVVARAPISTRNSRNSRQAEPARTNRSAFWGRIVDDGADVADLGVVRTGIPLRC